MKRVLFLPPPGAEHAGELYLVIGSASGTEPGVSVAGSTIPLNLDWYSTLMLTQPNVAPFLNTFGTIDPWGYAVANIDLPGGSPASLVGLHLHHAFVLIDPLTGDLTHVSNTTTLDIVD